MYSEVLFGFPFNIISDFNALFKKHSQEEDALDFQLHDSICSAISLSSLSLSISPNLNFIKHFSWFFFFKMSEEARNDKLSTKEILSITWLFLLLLYCILAPLLAKDEPVTVISASFPDALQVPSNDLMYYKTSQRNKAL